MSAYTSENPVLIHEGPRGPAMWMLQQPRAPLFLVHDGGGTNFSYHLLDPLDRPLWGVENAKLHAGGWWEGGIPEMAAHYINLISRVMPEGGDIILGGWSLGGHLSLEMAHQIAVAGRNGSITCGSDAGSSDKSSRTGSPAAPQFRVLGMIFIDTVFPTQLEILRGPPAPEPVFLSSMESKAMKLKDKVNLNMTHARMMVQSWDMPQWEDGLKVPPTILLRAKEFVSRDPSQTFVDYVREYPLIGWEEYNEKHGNFIIEVVEVEGHHFSIFSFEHIEDVSKKIRRAADKLDQPEF